MRQDQDYSDDQDYPEDLNQPEDQIHCDEDQEDDVDEYVNEIVLERCNIFLPAPPFAWL